MLEKYVALCDCHVNLSGGLGACWKLELMTTSP